MKRRRRCRTVLAWFTVVSASGIWLSSAAGHLNLEPRLVEQGQATDLVIDLPRLQDGAPPVTLAVEAEALEMLASRFRETVGGDTRFDVRVRVDGRPGILDLVLRARYADGSSVDIDERLTVLPGTSEDPFPWVAVIVAAGLALALAATTIHLGRRQVANR